MCPREPFPARTHRGPLEWKEDLHLIWCHRNRLFSPCIPYPCGSLCRQKARTEKESNTRISIFSGGAQSELPKFRAPQPCRLGITPMTHLMKINRAGIRIYARNSPPPPSFLSALYLSPPLSISLSFFSDLQDKRFNNQRFKTQARRICT